MSISGSKKKKKLCKMVIFVIDLERPSCLSKNLDQQFAKESYYEILNLIIEQVDQSGVNVN